MPAIETPDATTRIDAIRERLPKIDPLADLRSLPDLREVMPDLRDVSRVGKDLGKMSRDIGRKSVEVVDKITGRRRSSPLRWIAVAIGVVATTAVVIVGAMAATGRWTTTRVSPRRLKASWTASDANGRSSGSGDPRLATERSLAGDASAIRGTIAGSDAFEEDTPSV